MCFRIQKFFYWLLFEEDDDELEARIHNDFFRITPEHWQRYLDFHLKTLSKFVG